MIDTKPFLRWAGGKTWLLKDIIDYIPNSFNNYYEPFLGGGAIFYYLKTNGLIKNKSYLSDINPHLILTYGIVKSRINELIDDLNQHLNSEDYYYQLRSQVFDDQVKLASQFIFLNRTSFNGIYRENLKGIYNVPYGFKEYNELFDIQNLRNSSRLFRNCFFSTKDFIKILHTVKSKDFVVIDPPYTVAHGDNGFIKYNQKIFSWDDQIRLKSFVDNLNQRGVYFLMTNACHESILSLFKGCGDISVLSRASQVGGRGAKRKKYKELILYNF